MKQAKKKDLNLTEIDKILAKNFSIPAGMSPADAVAKLGCYDSPDSDPDYGTTYVQLLEKHNDLEQQFRAMLPKNAVHLYQKMLEITVDINSIEQITSFRKGLKNGYLLSNYSKSQLNN